MPVRDGRNNRRDHKLMDGGIDVTPAMPAEHGAPFCLIGRLNARGHFELTPLSRRR